MVKRRLIQAASKEAVQAGSTLDTTFPVRVSVRPVHALRGVRSFLPACFSGLASDLGSGRR